MKTSKKVKVKVEITTNIIVNLLMEKSIRILREYGHKEVVVQVDISNLTLISSNRLNNPITPSADQVMDKAQLFSRVHTTLQAEEDFLLLMVLRCNLKKVVSSLGLSKGAPVALTMGNNSSNMVSLNNQFHPTWETQLVLKELSLILSKIHTINNL